VLDLASEIGVVEKSGAWFSFQGDRIGQGRDNTRNYLEQHTDVLDKIEALLLAKHGIVRGPALVAGEERPANGAAPANNKGASSPAAAAARPVAKGPAN